MMVQIGIWSRGSFSFLQQQLLCNMMKLQTTIQLNRIRLQDRMYKDLVNILWKVNRRKPAGPSSEHETIELEQFCWFWISWYLQMSVVYAIS